ncbi:MAG: hypothetical protein L3K00_08525 [Thermoplasmata archaeon]|nr:hypothetical protein [Thermoplasmata archaeon]
MPPKRAAIDPWPLLGFWMRAIGFFLVFAGTLVVVLGASPGGGCFTSLGSCGTGFLGQAANSIWAAKILWVLGLGALGAGAAIRLHWGLQWPENATPEHVNWLLADRRMNGLLFLISVVLLLVILWTFGNVAITIPTGG